MTTWLTVIGIGEDGLDGLAPTARAQVEAAEMLVGGPRHLAMVPPGAAERLCWQRPFAATIAAIAARRGRRVVVLASGDPMWFGAGATLARHFAREEMIVVPQVGAFALAAARLGWPLAECTCLSVHGRPLDALRLHLADRRRVLVLSEDGGTPAAVARLLSESGWGPSRLAVYAHLGGPGETFVAASAQEWADHRVADLNLIALECRAGPDARPLSRLAGLPDDAFAHDGQLTKREIRAATLAALAPVAGECLWDIGAGSGAIAIEWLRAAEATSAVAVERDPARAAIIARNAAALGVPLLEIVIGSAPQALGERPAPDAIFVGGGIAAADLLPALWRALRPGGRLVANVVSIEGERALLDWQARYGGELLRLAVSRAAPLGSRQAWRPLLPVTQLAVGKPAG